MQRKSTENKKGKKKTKVEEREMKAG